MYQIYLATGAAAPSLRRQPRVHLLGGRQDHPEVLGGVDQKLGDPSGRLQLLGADQGLVVVGEQLADVGDPWVSVPTGVTSRLKKNVPASPLASLIVPRAT